MDRVSRISGGQLVTLLLASRLSNCLLLPSDSVAGLNVWDRLIATVLSAVLLFILFLPTILVLHRHPKHGLIDCAYRYSRLCGKTIGVAYALLCLFILCLDIVQFCDFAEKIMHTSFSVTGLTIALIAVAFVASFYGIQALGRAASVVAVFSALCLVVFCAALLPEMRIVHFPPQASRGIGEIVTAAVRDLPRTAEIVAIGVLYPYVTGSRLRSAVYFCGGTAVFTALVAVTSLGVLGDFALQTAYPYYTAVTAAQIGVFERMDILVTAVWLSTFFIRLTLFCMLFTNAIRRLFGNTARTWSAIGGAVVLSAFTWLVLHTSAITEWQWLTVVYWGVLGAFCVALPLVFAIKKGVHA